MKTNFSNVTFFALAYLQAVCGYDVAEFSKGIQTGIFAEDPDGDAFIDYSCPEMQPFMVRSNVHRYVAMASPFYKTIKYVSGRNWTPLLDLAYKSAESLD